MISDGERLKALLQGARGRVILCAPFVKARVLRTLLSVVDKSIEVRIITRWRASEVAAGVSDLEALEIAESRKSTELRLLDELHAKLYVADDQCLIGSANLTASALGWASKNNIELLLPASVQDAEIGRLLKRLEAATPASAEVRDRIREEAEVLQSMDLPEAQEMNDDRTRHLPWLPRCAAPHLLYQIYRDTLTKAVAKGTREDGLADLQDIGLAQGLKVDEFNYAVKESLLCMPAIVRIIDEIPKGLADSEAHEMISLSRPDLESNDVKHQWRIVRDWMGTFFGDEFEVAPASFVTRLRPR